MGDPRQQGHAGGPWQEAAPHGHRYAPAYDQVRFSEVVVVGTGVAGLAAALGCSPRSVTVLTKGRLGEGGSSAWAQGGVAAAVGKDDDPHLHAADTLSVSGGLGDPHVVCLLTREGPLRIEELIALGARFDHHEGGGGPPAEPSFPPPGSAEEPAQPSLQPATSTEERAQPSLQPATSTEEPAQPSLQPPTSTEEPAQPASRSAGSGAGDRPPFATPPAPRDLALGREAAHSRRRILHAGGDATGAELVRALRESVRRAPGITVEEDTFALDLVVEGGSATSSTPAPGRRVVGVLALHRDGRRVLHLAGAVVLATGGLGQLFRYTTNPVEVTGDGLAMAARAGARLVDVEMVQFHPTALAVGEADGALPLLTEALRGEGAVLVDGDGHRFMPDEHPDAELAPRDVVARAIHRRREAGVPVYLDARDAVGDRFPQRFPTVFAKATAAGLDPRREPLPVTPAAHYHMGGVETDDRGRTTLSGLWACGEAACTGAHGANRLASNSLLEALVFGARVAADLAPRLSGLPATTPAALARLRAAGRPLAAAPQPPTPTGGPAQPPQPPTRTGGPAQPPQPPTRTGGPAQPPQPPIRTGGPAQPPQPPTSAEEPAQPASRSAGSGARKPLARPTTPPLEPATPAAGASPDPLLQDARALRARLRRTLWTRVGLLRDATGLGAALAELDALDLEWSRLATAAEPGDPARTVPRQVELAEVRNLLTAGRLVATAAFARPESRGAHQREDHPVEDPAWRRRLHLLWQTPPAPSIGGPTRTGAAPAPAPSIRILAGPHLGDGSHRDDPPVTGRLSPPQRSPSAAAVPARRRAALSRSPLPPSFAARGPRRTGPETPG